MEELTLTGLPIREALLVAGSYLLAVATKETGKLLEQLIGYLTDRMKQKRDALAQDDEG